MTSHQQMVRQFMTLCRQTVNDTPTLSPADDALRVALIREELNELKEGIANNDRVEIADALADLRYVTLGTAVTYGITSERLEKIPAEHNPGVDRAIMWAERYLHLIPESLTTQGGVSVDLQYWLRGILCQIDSIALHYDTPLAECFEVVHASNMTKLWRDWEVSDLLGRPEEDMSTTEGFECSGLIGIRNKGNVDDRVWLVKGDGTSEKYPKGKVIKSPSYQPADIAGVLARQEVGV